MYEHRKRVSLRKAYHDFDSAPEASVAVAVCAVTVCGVQLIQNYCLLADDDAERMM